MFLSNMAMADGESATNRINASSDVAVIGPVIVLLISRKSDSSSLNAFVARVINNKYVPKPVKYQ